MERVSDEWLNHTIKNGVDRTIGDYYKVLYALEELQARRKDEKDQGHVDHEEEALKSMPIKEAVKRCEEKSRDCNACACEYSQLEAGWIKF